MFIEELPTNLITIIETIAPYLFSSGLGAIVLAIYGKWSNKKKDYSDINKTDAETEQIQTITIKNLTQELTAVTDKLIKQVDINTIIKENLITNSDRSGFKLRTKEEQLITSARKTLNCLAKLEEADFILVAQINSTRRLMDKLQIPYWEADAEGKSTYLSESWLKLFNVTVDTLDSWVDTVVEEDRERLIKEWKIKVIDQDASSYLTFRILDKDNKELHLKSFYAIVRSKTGNIDKIIGVTLPA